MKLRLVLGVMLVGLASACGGGGDGGGSGGGGGGGPVQVTLEEWDGMVHVFQSFYGLIDDAERAVDRIGEWVKETTP